MRIDTTNFDRCLQTLEVSVQRLVSAAEGSVDHEIFRNAVIKAFELALELSVKLLRRALRDYGPSPRAIDALSFKDVFRHAAKHGLVDVEAVERWFAYRDNRNSTAHDYGVAFARQTVALLPGFLSDAAALSAALRR